MRAVRPILVASLTAFAVVASGGEANGLAKPGQYVYYWPTSPVVADAMLKLARVGPGDTVYDLGSGDGRIVILAAEKYGARAVGVEQDPALVQASRQSARERHVDDRVLFREGDFFTADISEATVVMLYLTPSLNRLLEPKLRAELRPGTRIVSNQFPIGDWIPNETAVPETGTELLLWTVPRRPARTPDVPFAPSHRAVVDAMLSLARVGADDVVYDLGSGDGRIVISAAQRYRAHGVGIEIDPPLVERSRQIAREGEVADIVSFLEGDLFTADVSPATVVTLFLSSPVNDMLHAKLRRELRPGARVVSHQFGIAGWTPDKTVRAADGTDLFLWTIGTR
jgi:methylase of polypeptide subunit release factors